MSKIQITLDASKIRPLVTSRSYQNKNGETVNLQEVKFELVAVKEPKTIFTDKNGKYRIDKTHFCSVIQTKDQRQAQAPKVYIGEGFTTIWTNDVQVHDAQIIQANQEETDGFPF